MTDSGEVAERSAWFRPPAPYEKGNRAAVRHGAFSAAIVEPKVRAFVEQLEVEEPQWIRSVDRAAVTAWAYAEVRAELVRAWVDEHGVLTTRGKATGAATLLIQLERQAADFRSRLGLDPLSRSRLNKDSAIAAAMVTEDLRRVREEGARLRQQHEKGPAA